MATKTLGLTPAALEKRRKYLTASDVAAVLGMDPYKTAYDVWIQKNPRYELEAEESSDAAKLGQALESGLIDYAINQTSPDLEIDHNQWRVAGNGVMAATLDAQTRDRTIIFEGKTTGLWNAFAPSLEEWGANGTDEVPMKVVCQTAAQLLSDPRAERVVIPALIAGRGVQIYNVPRSELIETIEEQCLEWWQTYVLTQTPPPIETKGPDMGLLNRIKREEGSVCKIEYRLVEAWIKAKEVEKQAKKLKDVAQAELIAALGDCEGGECDEGIFRYRKENAGMQLNRKALQEKHPEIYRTFSTPGTRMMPRWKKAQAKKGVRSKGKKGAK